MKRKSLFPAVFVSVLLSLFFLVQGPALSKESPASAEAVIQSQGLLAIIQKLAAPEFEGRAAGSAGARKAADYIAREFKKIGLRRPGEKGSYRQPFLVTMGTRLGRDNGLALDYRGKEKNYEPRVSFVPFGYSDQGKIDGEVVFAGYGITAPELDYDDYADLEVKDKIVLVMTHEPQERNEQGPFRRAEAYRYTEARYKVWNAREHGAKGIMIVTDPNNHEREELFAIRGGGGASAGIVAVNVSREVAEALLTAAGKDLSRLQREIDEDLKPRSFPLAGMTARLRVSLITDKGRTANVIGILPGSDPALKGEAVVIGAHYDHLGRGGENSLAPSQYGKIHPGADDNASGVAGVIALARAFARSSPKRTMIFAAFSGEEIGLLGSTYYVKKPPWPLDKTYAMINLDMIGRIKDDRLHILGVRSAEEFRPLIEQSAEGLGLDLAFSQNTYGPSDHTPFYAKGRPVLMFFTGPHPDYHRPSDTPDKINGPGTERVVRLVFRTASRLAEARRPLTFVRREEKPGRFGRSRGGGYGAYFGSVPDFSGSAAPGLRLSGVRPGSPAEKAGLTAGDVIVKFGGMGIRNIEDLVFALRSKRPGDRVEVHYLRDGKELTGETTLEERR